MYKRILVPVDGSTTSNRALTSALQLLGVPAASLVNLNRALEQFESFCTVTQSVRLGIPVAVEVFDALGVRLK